jgi:hypothetical protein
VDQRDHRTTLGAANLRANEGAFYACKDPAPERRIEMVVPASALAPAAASVAFHDLIYVSDMRASEFDQEKFFAAIERSRVRALLIGRQALIALGLPLATSDYDFWLASSDIERFNDALDSFDLVPNRTPDEARKVGRYVLENDERIDVLVAGRVTAVDGDVVVFEDVWKRRDVVDVGAGVRIALPCLDDLIRTKRFAARPKDAEDIRMLEVLRSEDDDKG